MNHWNYRLIRHTEEDGIVWYAIHEAHYGDMDNDDGSDYVALKEMPHSIATLPSNIAGDTVKEIGWALEKMVEATKKPILNFEDF